MELIWGGLPPAVLIAWTIVLYIRAHRRVISSETPVREAILKSAALVGGWIVLGTELLGKFNAITFGPILMWWLAPLLIAVVYIARYRAPFPKIPARFSKLEWLTIAAIVWLVLLSLVVAVRYPPLTYDAMTYHMPRQLFWMQQHNVEHFSTINLRQTVMPPFMEFLGLLLMVMTNSDRLYQLIQWCSLLILLVPISLTTRRLGGDRFTQLAACLLAVVCPMVFLQSNNAKNDVVVGMWVMMAAWWTIDSLDVPLSWSRAFYIGLALGCGALTKGTGQLFTIPIVIVLCIAVARRLSMRSIGALVLAGTIALAINMPHFARNYRAWGSPNGPNAAQGGYAIYNTEHDISAIASNALRNIVWNMAVSSKAVNEWEYRMVVWLHDHVLHRDVSDPATTAYGGHYDPPQYDPGHDTNVGSLPHVLLFLTLPFALAIAALRKKPISVSRGLILFAFSVSGFFIFATFISWLPFHNRYFIALTAMLCPPVAVVWLATAGPKFRFVAVVLMIAIIYPTVQKMPRPPLSKRFTDSPEFWGGRFMFSSPSNRADLYALAEAMKTRPFAKIGFCGDGDFADYLVQRMALDIAQRRGLPPPEFTNVAPSFPVPGSKVIEPDLIVTKPGVESYFDEPTGADFFASRRGEYFRVLWPASPAVEKRDQFYGFDNPSGLLPAEGPYPKWRLPVVRWALFPETKLRVHAENAGPYTLRMVLRISDPTQGLTVELNGREIMKKSLLRDWPWLVFHLNLPLEKGDNEIALRYSSGTPGADGKSRVVLYHVLQVYPTPAATHEIVPASQ